MLNDMIEVIVPTRNEALAKCYEGIKDNTPPITKYFVYPDIGNGQANIRYNGAVVSKAEYILLLDDDVYMRPGLVQKYLDKILEGYDAVCGNTEPAPTGPFGKYVKQYMTNPTTFFYPVGCTLWKREKFIKIMDSVGIDVPEGVLQSQIKKDGYKVIRVEDAVCDHMTYVTASNFFRKRIVYGVIIGKSAMKDGTFIKLYLKMLFGIPLAILKPGVLLYRVATFLGMTKYLWGTEK